MGTKIYRTTNYGMFRRLLGNRDVTEARISKIVNRIEENGYIESPIAINEKYEVIDGQGRLEALKRLKMPVDYYVVEGAGLKQNTKRSIALIVAQRCTSLTRNHRNDSRRMERKMIVKRITEVETECPKIGDQISVDHYTATCQKITPKGALFLLDQYLDKDLPMNWANTNKGGYPKSGLRKALQSDDVLDIFADIRNYMVPFDNGDLLRLPFAGEMFGDNLPDWVKPDGHEQWPLMVDSHNRAASRRGSREWGWLQNKVKDSSANFCSVSLDGYVRRWDASSVVGVRPVFQIAADGGDKR